MRCYASTEVFILISSSPVCLLIYPNWFLSPIISSESIAASRKLVLLKKWISFSKSQKNAGEKYTVVRGSEGIMDMSFDYSGKQNDPARHQARCVARENFSSSRHRCQNYYQQVKFSGGGLSGSCGAFEDKMVAGEVLTILHKMKPFQQIGAATMMNASKVYSVSYANTILAYTPRDQLADLDKPKRSRAG